MNKYSSKAVKTAATVGMSLAMVLGNVTPVVMNVAAACTTATLKGLEEKLKTAGITEDTMLYLTSEDEVKVEKAGTKADYYNADEKIAFGDVPVTGLTVVADTATVGENQITLTNAQALELTVDYQGEEDALYLANATNKISETNPVAEGNILYYQVAAANTIEKTAGTVGTTSYENLFNLIKGSWNTELTDINGNCANTTADIADYLLDLESEVSKMFGKNYDGNQGFVKAVADKGDKVTDADLQALYDFKDEYANNLTDAQSRFLNNTIYDAEQELGYDSSTSSYQKELSNYVDELTSDFDDFIEDDVYTKKNGSAITKSVIKGKIADIKQEAKYSKFRNEEAVKDVIASYEALYDEIKAVEDALDKKNDAYVDYTKSGNNSVKNKYASLDVDEKIDQMKTAHFETYKAFKEAIVDAVYTMEAKESVNRYIDKSTKSPFVTSDQLDRILKDFDAKAELYDIYDDEEGTFGWDELEAHMNKVNESLTTLEDLSKYDAISLTVNDKDALIKMDDAVYFLQTDGKENLNAAQTRTVRDASRKVTELMEAYRKSFGSIDSTLNGWINKGNGDYAYYENGVAPSYKWVASGSNWYFVKDGVMMRNYWLATDGGRWYYLDNEGKMVTNQSVDGCWINSYGVYMSPSYNG